MFLKKIIPFFVFLFTLPLLSFSQKSKIDSLLNAIMSPKEDTIKANLLNELTSQYIKANAYDAALKRSEDAMKLSKELNFKNGMAVALRNCALSYYYKGNFRAMKEYLLQAMAIRMEQGNKKSIAGLYSNIGVAHWSLGDYVGAQQSYLEALKILEQLKDTDGVATVELNLGILSWSQEKYKEALGFYERSLKVQREMGDKRGEANAYSNMANTYHSLKDYEKAMDYNVKALKLRIELNDSTDIANSYTNIANVFSAKKEYEKAGDYEKKALLIKRRLGDKNGQAFVLLNMGEHLVELNRPKEALALMDSALVYAIETNDLELQKNVYDGLCDAYAKSGNSEMGLKYYKLFIKVKDSLMNEKNIQKMTEAQMNYEFDKKQREEQLIQKQKDELAQAESKRQSMIRNFFIAGFVLVLLAAVMILRSLSQTKKANQIIASQKKEVELQKEIVDLKNKDMTDSINYAQKIQDAVFPDKEIKYRLFPDAFVYFRPRDIVSGDFYWFAKKNGKRFIAAVDCTGHGVPGAFMSIIGNHLLNEIVLGKGILQPAEILNHLHQGVKAALKQDEQKKQADGMDIALCCLDESGNVEFAGAHRPMYLISDGTLKEIKADKFPIGGADAREDKKFTNHILNLKKGNVIYISSDGFADQFGGSTGKKLMSKNFKELLLANSNLTMPEQEKILDDTFMKWKGNREQVDDILVIGVRI